MTLQADQSKQLTAVLDFVAPPWPNQYNESPLVTVNLLDPSGDSAGSLGKITSCEANGDQGASEGPGSQEDSDFGDAPDSYKTLRASGGAHHQAGPLTLGNSVDVETDGLPTVDAYGDDHTQWDDEDTVLYPGDLSLTPGKSGRVRLWVNNGDGAHAHSGTVAGWIDFNGDGQFQNSTEVLGATQITIPGGGQAPVELNFSIPGDSKIGLSYARLRLYRNETNAAAPVVSPTGWGGTGSFGRLD